jgi:hypothetical protein
LSFSPVSIFPDRPGEKIGTSPNRQAQPDHVYFSRKEVGYAPLKMPPDISIRAIVGSIVLVTDPLEPE